MDARASPPELPPPPPRPPLPPRPLWLPLGPPVLPPKPLRTGPPHCLPPLASSTLSAARSDGALPTIAHMKSRKAGMAYLSWSGAGGRRWRGERKRAETVAEAVVQAAATRWAAPSGAWAGAGRPRRSSGAVRAMLAFSGQVTGAIVAATHVNTLWLAEQQGAGCDAAAHARRRPPPPPLAACRLGFLSNYVAPSK